MANVLAELGEYLEDGGVGTIGTDMFLAKMPDDSIAPDNAIAIIDTGGAGASTANPQRTLTFQVLVRNTGYNAAITLANSVRTLLHNDDSNVRTDYELEAGKTRVLVSQAVQEPFNLGQDDNNRYEITANYQLIIDN